MLLTPRQCNGISVPSMVTDFPQCRPQEMRNPNQELQRLRMQACRAQKNQTCGLKDTLVLVVVACYVLSDWDLPLAEAVGRMLQGVGAAMVAVATGESGACGILVREDAR